jgi:hypothetical protein
VCATLRTELPSHTIVLLELLDLAAGVAEGSQGNLHFGSGLRNTSRYKGSSVSCLGGEPKVRPESPLTAGTMTQGRPRFVRRAQFYNELDLVADTATAKNVGHVVELLEVASSKELCL